MKLGKVASGVAPRTITGGGAGRAGSSVAAGSRFWANAGTAVKASAPQLPTTRRGNQRRSLVSRFTGPIPSEVGGGLLLFLHGATARWREKGSGTIVRPTGACLADAEPVPVRHGVPGRCQNHILTGVGQGNRLRRRHPRQGRLAHTVRAAAAGRRVAAARQVRSRHDRLQSHRARRRYRAARR